MHVMNHGILRGGLFRFSLVPGRIAIVGDKVADFSDPPVVQPLVKPHHIGRDRRVGIIFQSLNLKSHEIKHLLRVETLEVEHCQIHGPVIRIHLIPCGVPMPPECGPVELVQTLQRAVALFQKIDELLPAERTVARAVVFVADVPPGERRMRGITLRELPDDESKFRPHDRRAPAVIFPYAPGLPDPLCGNPVRLGILVREPCGTRGGRSGEEHLLLMNPAAFHDVVKP